MNTKFRVLTDAHRSAVVAACLLALVGCRDRDSAGGAAHEDDHAGHVIPAHKPKTFPDAVRRLRELNDQMLFSVAGGKTGTPSDDKTLQFALDIANWLPEIAAVSDMPETPWDEVNARSARLVADYQELISSAATYARRELEQANVEIGNLEKLLLACNPRWFEAIANFVAAPQ